MNGKTDNKYFPADMVRFLKKKYWSSELVLQNLGNIIFSVEYYAKKHKVPKI